MDGQRSESRPTDAPAAGGVSWLAQWHADADALTARVTAPLPAKWDGIEILLPDITTAAMDKSQAAAQRACPDLPIRGWLVTGAAVNLTDGNSVTRCAAHVQLCALLERATDAPVERITLAVEPPPTDAADARVTERLDRAAVAVERLVILAEQAGVLLCLPAGPAGLLRTPTEGRLLAEWINHPAFAVDLDGAGALPASPVDVGAWLANLGALVRCVGLPADSMDGGRPQAADGWLDQLGPAAEVERGIDRPLHCVTRSWPG